MNAGDDERAELGYKLKPDTFDGTVPLHEFLPIQFSGPRESGSRNEIRCVEPPGKSAFSFVENLETLNYEELKTKLQLRFGEEFLSQ